jgi:hypothetical protein
MQLRTKVTAIALASWSGVAFAGPSDVVIDDFAVSQTVTATTAVVVMGEARGASSGDVQDGVAPPGDHILGDERDIYAGVTSTIALGLQAVLDTKTTLGGEDYLSISYNSGTTGPSYLVWDGNASDAGWAGGFVGDTSLLPSVDTSGLTDGAGGIDLTAGGVNSGILFDVLSIDTSVTATFEIWEFGGGASSSASHTFAAGESHLFRYDDFTNGLDYTDVGAVRLTLVGGEAWDADVRLIVSTQVPAPAPIALLGAGLIGMSFSLRRRRRSKHLGGVSG